MDSINRQIRRNLGIEPIIDMEGSGLTREERNFRDELVAMYVEQGVDESEARAIVNELRRRVLSGKASSNPMAELKRAKKIVSRRQAKKPSSNTNASRAMKLSHERKIPLKEAWAIIKNEAVPVAPVIDNIIEPMPHIDDIILMRNLADRLSSSLENRLSHLIDNERIDREAANWLLEIFDTI